MPDLDMDVDAPDKVLPVLRRIVDAYNESAMELDSAWQDKGAGRPRHLIAKELEATIARLEKKLK